MEKEKKRQLSPMLRKVLNSDVQLTQSLTKYLEKFVALKQLKTHCTALEISCHGMVWIPLLMALIWILNDKNLYQLQVNLLIGLVLDIVIVAMLKAITRRRRPTEDTTSIGPDKYAFPSGHASRAVLVFYFFCYLWPVSTVFLPPLLAWVFSVSMSRLLIKKHHILDVICGLLLGYIEGMLMGLLYLDAETCIGLISWITDEKLQGGEYHV